MKRVGILRGGKGKHYENSLQKGGEIISYLLENLSEKYKPIDILIDRAEVWHLNGLPLKPSDLIHKIDFIWNFSHSSYSEILKSFSIPTISLNSFSSGISQSREILRDHMKMIGVKMPNHLILPVYLEDLDGPKEEYITKKAKEVAQKFPAPWIVRSFNSDPSMGVHLAKTFPELVDSIQDGVDRNDSLLIEELITGKNAFLHTVSNFRKDPSYTFPAGKYSTQEKEKLLMLSKKIHSHLGNPHYLKSNFVLHPKNGIYLTGVEFHPDLKKDSHLQKVAELVGAKVNDVLEHILSSVSK